MDLEIAVPLGNFMQYGTIRINHVFGIADAFFKRMSNCEWHPAIDINNNDRYGGFSAFYVSMAWSTNLFGGNPLCYSDRKMSLYFFNSGIIFGSALRFPSTGKIHITHFNKLKCLEIFYFLHLSKFVRKLLMIIF
jgi:hypothetical protein